ncbi:hypothetical protein FUA23_17690 [Neolewinella aurantiaca]|uniref:Uncharacterized protein n=1 Tax=Neolewinella aurantiaca TaxID=2602767 RepID=A0A5C7FK89_9BACT|nr:hypothetical protein [Neolewinella aurantiaca]TXF87763.1 hypothetical protein FUA23_17690 [Neolewinella aurantiaca]
MDTANPYLNPVELFDLSEKPELKPADLRKAKKRFLTELELDGREDFDYHGRLFTRNDLDRVSQDIEDEAMLVAYVTAAKTKGLSAFLASGRTDQEFDSNQLFNPRLKPLLRSYFGPAFNQTFGRAVANQDQQAVDKMRNWKAESAGISPSVLYQDAYRNLDSKIEVLAGTVDAYLRDPKSPAAQNLRGMKAFDDNFPKELISALPPYFTDLTGKLADRLTPYIIRLNNERQNPRMALALTKSILRLENLADDKREQLKKIGRQLRDNVNTANHNREAQSSEGGMGAGRIVWLIIVLVVMLFRVGSCISSNSRSSRSNYRTNSYYAEQRYKPVSALTYKIRYAINLRQAVQRGLSPTAVTPDSRADIPSFLLSPLYRPGAGVLEANDVLRALNQDTVYHIERYVLSRRTTPFQVDKVFQQTIKRPVVAKDKDTSRLYLALDALNKELTEEARIREERRKEAEKKYTVSSKKYPGGIVVKADRGNGPPSAASNGVREVTSYAKEKKDQLLGPKAKMPANYYLYQKRGEKNDGRLMKMKAAPDAADVGLILVWRDTLGLRQVRMPGGLTAPFTFDVAVGQVDKLLEGYVVYGKLWSDTETSPFGGQGWYREVICYCGPNDHLAFINGKKSYRKNIWFPTKKIDTSKSMSPQAWLRGIKRLR